MSALDDLKQPAPVQIGSDGVHAVAVFGTGKESIRDRKGINVRGERAAHAPDGVRKFGKDAGDLLLFVQHEGAQLVVHFQHFLRLDEHRRAACGTVMHKSLDAALIFRLDGNDKAVPAHGDDAVLQIFPLFAGQIALQPRADALAELADLRAQGKERFARMVGKFVFVQDLAPDVLFQTLVEHEMFGEFPECRDAVVGKRAHGAVEHARRT